MTNEEFFSELGTAEWFFDTFNHRKPIRTKIGHHYACPLTYVSNKVLDLNLLSGEWKKAAEALGISYQRARAIVRAADQRCNTRSQKQLRKILLRETGLNVE